MWVVAGVLLGLVVLASLIGFHTGPHAHVVAGAAGLAAAAWLVAMAVDGRSSSLLWVLLGADLVVSAGVGVAAWSVLAHGTAAGPGYPPARLEAAEGVALSDLDPEGIVRVGGEQWSAVSVNGTVRRGTGVQVLRAGGVRLEVWGEETEPPPAGGLPDLDRGGREGRWA
jgi:membrane-bound ClpP family serine protease